MSKNQENQDNEEQKCLDLVKRKLNKNDCFGMSNQQYNELQKWLKDAKPNHNSNKFPDITFEDGFIEHFKVTSSAEDKKGSKQKRESSNFERYSKNTFLSNLDSREEDMLVSNSFFREFEEHTYLNIVNSIKKNWEKHIESYDKQTSPSKHGIFLLEYIDINIQTAINRENEPAECYCSYRISADRYLLEWIHRFKEKIEYLILINPLSIEVIRLDQILNIIESIPRVVTYAPIEGILSHNILGYKTKKRDI
ncbi:hypothetical protein [Streptomyces sp. NPDC057131]|uniref:hypothetical protein n=1 Tax=Streptomyces sp. NPDC057131 TaxID=3346027 RepID=UPI0036D3E10B